MSLMASSLALRFCSAFHTALRFVVVAGVAASPSALSLAASSSASSSKTTSLRFLGMPSPFAACGLVRLALLPAAVVVESEAVEVEAVSSTARGGGCGAGGAAAIGAAAGAACPSSSNRSLRGMASESPRVCGSLVERIPKFSHARPRFAVAIHTDMSSSQRSEAILCKAKQIWPLGYVARRLPELFASSPVSDIFIGAACFTTLNTGSQRFLLDGQRLGISFSLK